MAASLASIGAYFYVIDQVSMDWIPMAALVTFMVGYSIGFASIPFVLMGELLPLQYKNVMSGLASR